MDDFWNRITLCLKEIGMTQYHLAEACGMSLPTFNRLKSQGKYPPVEVIFRMAEILGKTVQFILTGHDAEDPAIDIVLNHPGIKDLVILLGKHPDQAPILKAYLEGLIKK